jgi:hypothetical protein
MEEMEEMEVMTGIKSMTNDVRKERRRLLRRQMRFIGWIKEATK